MTPCKTVSARVFLLPRREGEMTRLLRFSEVMAITGLIRSSLYRRLAADEFPEPIMVGPRSIRFKQDDVERWVDSRPGRYG